MCKNFGDFLFGSALLIRPPELKCWESVCWGAQSVLRISLQCAIEIATMGSARAQSDSSRMCRCAFSMPTITAYNQCKDDHWGGCCL